MNRVSITFVFMLMLMYMLHLMCIYVLPYMFDSIGLHVDCSCLCWYVLS